MNALVGLGSNVGDRVQFLAQAVRGLRGVAVGESIRVSHLYETRPWGEVEQPDFLNAAALFEPALRDAGSLLARLQAIEAEAGRERGMRWGPRTLDLDLLDLGGQVIEEGEGLTLPHPRMAERAFVLVPLNSFFVLFMSYERNIYDPTLVAP